MYRYHVSLLLISSSLLLSGCVGMSNPSTMNTPYAHNLTKTSLHPVPAVRVPATSSSVASVPAIENGTAVMTSANMTNNPEVIKAFHTLLKTGKATSIKGKGFLTLPFDPYKRPILTCAPLMACEVVLAAGEHINSVVLGDTLRWKVNQFSVGQGADASPIIAFKPTAEDIATNMTIATDKRIYQFGLMSKADANPVVVNFWYPNAMLVALRTARQQQQAKQADVISQMPAVGVNHLNFNYILVGDRPTWAPTKVFDDGIKTFIDFPPSVDRTQLPVLYVFQNGKQALINYRYRRPYMIVDGLFTKAQLISGKGSHKTVVEIRNQARGANT